jgi:hypothetical protein
MLVTRGTYQRTAVGIVVTLTGLGALLALMLPFRAHLSIAIPALVFVLPAVILGVVIGGFLPGRRRRGGGFLILRLVLPSAVRHLHGALAAELDRLFVYVVVVLIVARVVTKLQDAREEALRRTEESERLFELSQALIGDLTLSQLLTHIAGTVQTVFAPRWTALVLPDAGDGVGPTGSAETLRGRPAGQLSRTRTWPPSLRRRPDPNPSGWKTTSGPPGGGGAGGEQPPRGHAGAPGRAAGRRDRSPARHFANQAALAVDRAQLREQALRARLLEEIDRWRRALMGAARTTCARRSPPSRPPCRACARTAPSLGPTTGPSSSSSSSSSRTGWPGWSPTSST